MNDFDSENEAPERETKVETVASGLLPRERFRPDARLAVVDEPERAREAERLYREIPVRVDGVGTVLLVGPWCDLQRDRSYRIRKRDAGNRKRGGGNAVGTLVTVEIVVRYDADGRRYRA